MSYVPTLRFKGFCGDWHKEKLSQFLIVSSKRNKDEYFTRNDVLSVSGDLGVVNQIELLGRSYAGASLIPYHIVDVDDVVYTKSPLAEFPYGIIKTNRKKAGIVSTLYAIYKTTSRANNFFIEHYFSLKSRINNYLKPIVKIGAKHDMKIGNNAVLDNYVVFPDKDEQDKIALFLDILDNRISTQSKIIDKLKFLKKIISDNLLYNKNYEYTTLNKFGCLKNGYAFKSESYDAKGAYSIVTIANVQGERNTTKDNYNKINKIPEDIQKHQILGKTDILISLTGNVGRVSLNNNDNALLNQRVGKFELFNNEDLEYIYQCLAHSTFERTMIKRGQGVAQLNIAKEDVESFNIPVLLNKLIIKLLNNYDNLIIVELNYLEKLKEQKKYLLSHMFI